MQETWRDIPGFRGYQVTEGGAVRSIDRDIVHKNGTVCRVRGQVLTCRPDKDGYPRVKAGGRTRRVHILVLLAFVGPPPDGHEAAHEDGNRANPHLSNLRYATHRENVADKVRHGTAQAGENHPRAKLSAAAVSEMKRLRGTVTNVALWRRFGIGRSQFYRIVRGEAWA